METSGQHVRSSKDQAAPGLAQGFQGTEKHLGNKKASLILKTIACGRMLLMSLMAAGQHGKAELTGQQCPAPAAQVV